MFKSIEECPPTDMFDHLKGYRYILLTGPHRSGTTIASHMIVNDLGIEYHEEEDVNHFHVINSKADIDFRNYFKEHEGPMVLRCPAYCHKVHTYKDVEGLVVVMLMRPVEEIQASQERVLFGYAGPQMKFYPDYEPPVALAKYSYWFDVQEEVLGDRGYMLDYHSLKNHPMWISKEKRAEFHVRQTKEDDPRGQRYQLKPHEYNRVKEY